MLTAAETLQLLNNPAPKPQKPLSDAPRAAYWRDYHAQRQATDPTYRARKIATAVKHKAALKETK